jgi:hypothetical protein
MHFSAHEKAVPQRTNATFAMLWILHLISEIISKQSFTLQFAKPNFAINRQHCMEYASRLPFD